MMRRSPHQHDPSLAPPQIELVGLHGDLILGVRDTSAQVFVKQRGVPRAQDNRLAIDLVYGRQRRGPIPAVVDQTSHIRRWRAAACIRPRPKGSSTRRSLTPGAGEAEPLGELRSASSSGMIPNPSRPARRWHGARGAPVESVNLHCLRPGDGDHSSAGRSPPPCLPGTAVRIAEAACRRFAAGVQLHTVSWKRRDQPGPRPVTAADPRRAVRPQRDRPDEFWQRMTALRAGRPDDHSAAAR